MRDTMTGNISFPKSISFTEAMFIVLKAYKKFNWNQPSNKVVVVNGYKVWIYRNYVTISLEGEL